ncbi:hypothetical protein BWQ96_00943 [Gracilariopsis chorda]|uniref:Uncharacterized protein n=1 Tax=Gracilariopsis chorda TaxID=448386 RepID=A0A2V3J4R0_9FLOR|nr:hypothetical protein BWQ96_00943 [Gracilariopsis chorda]|eukprot:PXF49369.1 hypothetical protein BWQ96_00943 [Gracilariopsis chorda]
MLSSLMIMALVLLKQYDSDSSEEHISGEDKYQQPTTTHILTPIPAPCTENKAHTTAETITTNRAVCTEHKPQHPRAPPAERHLSEKTATSSASTDALSIDHQLPPDLAAELRRAGHHPSQVSIVDVNATTNMRVANSNDHIPPSALRNTATRLAHQISKSRNVGRVARRKHQITALAADALALQAAQAVLPGSASRRKR